MSEWIDVLYASMPASVLATTLCNNDRAPTVTAMDRTLWTLLHA